MRRGWWRRVLIALGGILVVLSTLPIIALAALRLTAPSADALLRARGLPLSHAGWEAWHNDQPNAPNAAALYLEAANHLRDDKEAALALLLEGVDYDYCRLPFWEHPNFWMSHSSSRDGSDFTRLLQDEFHHALAQGDCPRVIRAVEAMLAMATAAVQHPTSLDHMAANSMGSTAVLHLFQAVNEGCLSPESLERLERRIDFLLDDGHVRRAVLGTIAQTLAVREAQMDSAPQLSFFRNLWRGIVDPDLRDSPWLGRLRRWSSLPRREQAVIVRDYLRTHDVLLKTFPEQRKAVREWEYSQDPVITLVESAFRAPYHLARIGDPDFFVSTASRHRARIATTRAALTVERFRLVHGRLPASAEELEMENMPLPPDPLGEGLIHYARDAEGGYRTWSAGADWMNPGGIDQPGGWPDLVFRVAPTHESVKE